jgi:hypothetical protein
VWHAFDGRSAKGVHSEAFLQGGGVLAILFNDDIFFFAALFIAFLSLFLDGIIQSSHLRWMRVDSVSSSDAPEARKLNIAFTVGGIAYVMAIGYSVIRRQFSFARIE